MKDVPMYSQISIQQKADLAALTIALMGESVIDMPACWFTTRAEVDDFLRLSAFDTDNLLDMAKLNDIHHEAVAYLIDIHRYRLPLQVEQPEEIHDLFLLATSSSITRAKKFACMTLKVMHILHHIQGHELLFNAAISEAQIFERLNDRIFSMIDTMRASGIAIQEFAAGKKSKASLATKLLAKRNNLATHIFDKLRFRIVVRTRDDLVLSLIYLLRNFIPFNYIVPDQSKNNIITTHDISRVLNIPIDVIEQDWLNTHGRKLIKNISNNEFTASTYRCINFVADIPMRIDDITPQKLFPAIVFVQTEIQLVDAETEKTNEKGDSSHDLYKKRQRNRVRSRLECDTPTMPNLLLKID